MVPIVEVLKKIEKGSHGHESLTRRYILSLAILLDASAISNGIYVCEIIEATKIITLVLFTYRKVYNIS
jgi:hypothetical protein